MQQLNITVMIALACDNKIMLGAIQTCFDVLKVAKKSSLV